MTILVHLNKGQSKSYLLQFGSGICKRDVQELVRRDEDEAVTALMSYARLYSVVRREVSQRDRLKAEREADMVISQQGYVAERLA